jgi:hypothetical protein
MPLLYIQQRAITRIFRHRPETVARTGLAARNQAVWCRTSDPQTHLRGYRGILQADAYSGYAQVYADGSVIEAACMAHYPRSCFIQSRVASHAISSNDARGAWCQHNVRHCDDVQGRRGEEPCKLPSTRRRARRPISLSASGAERFCLCAHCIRTEVAPLPGTAAMHGLTHRGCA